MKTLAILAIVLALSATAANAQVTITSPPATPSIAFGVDPILRITSTFRRKLPDIFGLTH